MEVGLMRNGKLLAEKSPDALLKEHKATLLEDIVLQLCRKDQGLLLAGDTVDDPRKVDPVTATLSEISFYSKRKIFPFKPKESEYNMHLQSEIVGINYKRKYSMKPTDMNNMKRRQSIIEIVNDEAKAQRNRIRALIVRNIFVWYAFQVTLTALTIGYDVKDMSIGVINNEFPNWLEECGTEERGCSSGNLEGLSCRYLNSLPKDTLNLIPYNTKEEAVDDVHRGNLWGILTIPANYSKHIIDRSTAGNFAENDTLEGTILRTHLDMSHYMAAVLMVRKFYLSFETYIKELGVDCGGMAKEFEIPLHYREPVYGSQESKYKEYIIPGALTMLLFLIPMCSCGLAYISDKKQGTMERSRSAGVTTFDFMMAFFFTEGLVIIIQAILSTTILTLGFDFTINGSIVWYTLLCLLAGLCGQSWGFILGLICSDETSVLLTAFFIYLPMLILTGITWPLEAVPLYMRYFSYCLPGTLPTESMRSIVLLVFVAPYSSNYIGSNVTKVSSTKRIIYLNTTSTAQPVSQARPVTTSETDSKVPKAISVKADSSGGYAVFPMPPPSVPIFPFAGNGVEETFTYQVKKQRQPPSKPEDLKAEFDFLKAKAMTDSYEAMQKYVNELNYNTSEKINNITKAVEETASAVLANESIFNATINQQSMQVANMMSLSNETSRTVKLLQYAHGQDKVALIQQISNLTMLIEKLQRERSEDRARTRTELSLLQAKIDNTTEEIRVHEAHLRYGQQAMLSLRNSVEKNANQIVDLEKSSGPQWAEQTVGCGGVLIANSGLISYKFRQLYMNDERCVWTVRVNTRSKINLQLLEDGFQNQSNSDFLTVTEFGEADDQHPVTLLTSTRLEHGSKALHTFQGPVIFITFYSDSSIPGTENGATYQPNELMTLAINPNNNSSSMKIQMKWSDLEKDEFCEFDSINFYGSVQGSYALTKRYCQQDEKFNGEIIHSSDGIFLVIFRSDASTQFSGFQFTWEAD
ncbi:ABC transporter G family member 23 [Orchesella cincta]|uniref:ABC transporter G family member 23 n=1 Tax=Orchesella cincta TaxID=48709 RepID=A0A1D2MWH7_ORCCI|nr:ABC transporter G family member 23 [Orchesella cincta]